MSDNDRVVARPARQSPIACCDVRIAPYALIQFGNNRVTINSIRFVYGGLPIGESALRVTGYGLRVEKRLRPARSLDCHVKLRNCTLFRLTYETMCLPRRSGPRNHLLNVRFHFIGQQCYFWMGLCINTENFIGKCLADC